jgi:DNA primase
MSSSTVQKIKERLPITDVIGSYIDIEKSGSSLKAKCPFHNEKTPSFFISADRGNYYCFGCGVKGDIFTFVQEFEGVDFVTALKLLADRAGVPIERYEGGADKDPKARLYEAMEAATTFFQNNLKEEKEALMYLKNRKLAIETLRDWRLGFAKNDWRTLKTHLRSLGFSEKEILDAGLIKENEKAGESYDRFRGRIMFPIFDTAERVNAFSGRVLAKDEEPKYLNSPDTPLFDKSKSLYGYHIAKHAMREKGFAILVEGQMDLLMSHQAGHKNTIASSGTALTTYHLEMIKRLAPTIVIAYDADNAGRNATFRAWKLALSHGLEVKIALLPNGIDPADAIGENSTVWADAVANAKNVVDYFIEAMKLEGDRKAEDKVLKEKILPLVKAIESQIDQSRTLQKVSFATGIAESALREELLKVKDEEMQTSIATSSKPKEATSAMRTLGFLLWLRSKGNEYATDFEKGLVRIQPHILEKIPDDGDEHALLFEIEMHYGGEADLKSVGTALLRRLEEETLKDEFARAMERLKKAEALHDQQVVDRELRFCQDLSFKISALGKAP